MCKDCSITYKDVVLGKIVPKYVKMVLKYGRMVSKCVTNTRENFAETFLSKTYSVQDAFRLRRHLKSFRKCFRRLYNEEIFLQKGKELSQE